MSEFTEHRHGVRAIKDHRCDFCGRTIAKGTPHAVSSGRYDGAWQRARYHQPCQAAIAEACRNNGGDGIYLNDYGDAERVLAFVDADVLEEALAYFEPHRLAAGAWRELLEAEGLPGAWRELAEARLRAQVHMLKTWPPYFEAIVSGEKTLELRRDDRGYQVDDVLKLCEFDPEAGRYTGRQHHVVITHLIRGPQFGIEAGWAALSIKAIAF